jgi:hypothetical protein
MGIHFGDDKHGALYPLRDLGTLPTLYRLASTPIKHGFSRPYLRRLLPGSSSGASEADENR